MAIGPLGSYPTAGRTLQKPLLDQEGLVEIFESAGILADGRSDGSDPCRSTAIVLDQGREDLPIDRVEAELVDL